MAFSENNPFIRQMLRELKVVEHNRVRLPSCAPCAPDPDVSEKDFQALVLRQAADCGFLCYHTYDSRKSEEGFPDLVMVRERVIYAELKSATGKLTRPQALWLSALKEAGQEVWIWRPGDWTEIVAALARPGAPPPPPSPSGPKAA
jgi:hypothetical protein